METTEICVFVTQEQPHIDYTQAENFGRVTFVSVHDVPTIEQSLRATNMIEDIASIFSSYRAGVDIILPSGSPLNIAVVMMLAGRRGDRHNILKWDSRGKRYTQAIVEIPHGI